MKTYIALLRGINVGGKTVLPMKELSRILEKLGAHCVQTYIQSGNAVFRHGTRSASGLSSRITAAISEGRGFEPRVLLLELAEMQKAMAGNPFPEAESEPKSLHLFFLAAAPKNPDLETLERLKQRGEQFSLARTVLYLHTQEGFGKSKLAARAEKSLGVAATARNWRTVCKVASMAEECG